MSDAYLNDEKEINELYEQVIYYLPYSPMMKLYNIQKFIKQVMHSEINIFTKL